MLSFFIRLLNACISVCLFILYVSVVCQKRYTKMNKVEENCLKHLSKLFIARALFIFRISTVNSISCKMR